ncbi:MAG: hypothetical protein ACRDQA_10490 [Nocardioidaceae bacterium]
MTTPHRRTRMAGGWRVVTNLGRPLLVCAVVACIGYGVAHVVGVWPAAGGSGDVAATDQHAGPAGGGASGVSERGRASSAPRAGHGSPGADPAAAAPDAGGRWVAVLTEIDQRRARAWHRGRPAALRQVYTRGSPALAQDQAMLRAYVARGLHVDRVRLEFSFVAVERQSPDHVTLVVVDQLGRLVARTDSGRGQVLPRDRPTRHRLVLRHEGGHWRIARVSFVS